MLGKYIRFSLLLLLLINDVSEAKFVRDVDGTIIKEIQENPSNAYFIKFHAPWFVLVVYISIC